MFLRKILYITLVVFFLISILGYGFYKALPLILGPKIELSSPQNGDIIESTTVDIRGTVLRSQKLFVNGIATSFSTTGMFETRFPVFPGNNILTLVAFDKFGRSTSLTLNLGTK
jgi:hypothetical protein